MSPYGFYFVFRMVDGLYSKPYKTYMGCFKAARKLYPLDTDRMIFKVEWNKGCCHGETTCNVSAQIKVEFYGSGTFRLCLDCFTNYTEDYLEGIRSLQSLEG